MGRYTTRAQEEAEQAAKMTQEQIKAFEIIKLFEAKGGSYWSSDDMSKRRIYFNNRQVSNTNFSTPFFDLNTNTWHEKNGNLINAEDQAALIEKIGV